MGKLLKNYSNNNDVGHFSTSNRRSTLEKSVLALQPRCSMWCLTQAQPTCGCPRKAAHRSPLPVVSVHIQTFFSELSELNELRR